jgi:hypothetical protein
VCFAHDACWRAEVILLNALVLVCTVLVTPNLRDCNETNARVVMVAPLEFSNPVTCALQGQAYIAETAIGQTLGKSDRVKVVCRPRRSLETQMQTGVPGD